MEWDHIKELKVKNYKSFDDSEFIGFDEIKKINIIVGRNNSGKSALLDLVQLLGNPRDISNYGHEKKGSPVIRLVKKLTPENVNGVFNERRGGAFPGEHRAEATKFFLESNLGTMTFDLTVREKAIDYSFAGIFPDFPNETGKNEYENRFYEASKPPVGELFTRRLAADRNIQPEGKGDPDLDEKGVGASNYLYHYMRRDSGNERLVQNVLIPALNEIFDPYTHFETIDVKELGNSGSYEINVYEKDREPVKLTDSGSGFKTIFLVLINLLLVPDHERHDPSKIAFCFEEIENNLHPGLQRKLMAYIKKYARDKNSHIFLTTHSSAILDAMQTEDDVQIIHVKHNGKASKIANAVTRIDNNGVLDDLDVRASDILQANSLIWVEGPSDRVYISRFIDLYTDGRLIEGIHYQIVFYGGRLLAHLEAGGDGDAVDILKVNRNSIMVMDSDFSSTKKRLTPGKKKMKSAMNAINAPVWITKGREIENYLSGRLIASCVGKRAFPDVGTYTKFENYLSRKSAKLAKVFAQSKALFAENLAPNITTEDLKVQDLEEKIKLISHKVAKWNGIKL